jgi:hypothetical protein
MMGSMATLLLTLRGVVEAHPDAVAQVLLDARPGGRSPLAPTGAATPATAPSAAAASGTAGSGAGPGGASGAPDVFTVTQAGSRITVTVDPAARSVALQGEWWYRGVTSVTGHERGALVTHQIFNVAPAHRWAVRFVSRGPLAAAPAGFAEHLTALGAHLNCATHLLA